MTKEDTARRALELKHLLSSAEIFRRDQDELRRQLVKDLAAAQQALAYHDRRAAGIDKEIEDYEFRLRNSGYSKTEIARWVREQSEKALIRAAAQRDRKNQRDLKKARELKAALASMEEEE